MAITAGAGHSLGVTSRAVRRAIIAGMSGSVPLYDTIGTSYSATRQADPRIAAQIRTALGDARSVVNVGAGTGAYEPADLEVIAVDPLPVMISQRPPGTIRATEASAESLPLDDDSVDAAMAVLSDHHWADRAAGLREMCRVARHRVVLVNFEPEAVESFWLTRDYLPQFVDLIPKPYRTRGRWWHDVRELLGGDARLSALGVPHDCSDGFYMAYWRRPHAYLQADVRDNISVFHRISSADVDNAMEALRSDLDDGTWLERNSPLMKLAEADVGLRIVVAELPDWSVALCGRQLHRPSSPKPTGRSRDSTPG